MAQGRATQHQPSGITSVAIMLLPTNYKCGGFMLTDEQLQESLRYLEEETERRNQEYAAEQEQAQQAAAKTTDSPEPEDNILTPKDKMEEYLEDKDKSRELVAEAIEELYGNLETLAESATNQLNGTSTETTTPGQPFDTKGIDSTIAGVDAALLGAALAANLVYGQVKEHFQGEPEMAAHTQPLLDLDEPEVEAVQQIDPPKPFPSFAPPDLEDDIPASAKDRHEWAYQGIGDFGTISLSGKSAEQQMAEAGLREYEQFKAEQQALEDAIAVETDPARKEMLEMRRDIELAEYNEAMSMETARVEKALAGGEPSPEAVRYELLADQYHDEAAALNGQWAMHCVRDPDNYSPRDEEMSESVSKHKRQENDAWQDFNARADQEGWSLERREVEVSAFQQELDNSLAMAFDYSYSSPSMGL